MSIRSLLIGLLLGTCFVLPARAEDEDLGAETVRRTVDLPRYRVQPAPKGPRLSVPSDLTEQTGDETDTNIWHVDHVFENGTWLPFGEPSRADWSLGRDDVVELLDVLTQTADGQPDLDMGTTEDGIELSGARDHVDAAIGKLPWVLDALAPSVEVRATLSGTVTGEPERLHAMGRVTLWPNRWTRVYLQEDAVPCTVNWDLEVAQEATTMDPLPMEVSEGQELYLRYHPGQGVSLVEVWAGETEHVQIVRQDLSEVRNIPEANGPGVLSYPETAVNRVFGALVLHAGKHARRELAWTNQGRRSRLVLDFRAPPVPQRPMPLPGGRALSTLRVAAIADELEFDARQGTTGDWEDRISRVYYGVGEAYERKGRTFDFSVSSAADGSVLIVESPADLVAKGGDAIAEAEARLATRPVSLELLTVPEPAFRKALAAGEVAIGDTLAPEVLAAFTEAGATVGESVSTPVLLHMRVGFRVGHTVPGVTDIDAEIAQQSGGLHPETSARFAGIQGEMRLRKTGTGHALRVSGRLSWAERAAGTMEFVFRPPVSMAGAKTGDAPAPIRPRKVKLPILGGGGAPIDAEVEIAGRDKQLHLVHVHVRGREVVLLLAAVR